MLGTPLRTMLGGIVMAVVYCRRCHIEHEDTWDCVLRRWAAKSDEPVIPLPHGFGTHNGQRHLTGRKGT